MKEYKRYKFYFFDYLWWLGEKTQEHYQGQPRRPDGSSMVMMYAGFFIVFPLMVLLLLLGVFYLYVLILYFSLVFLWEPWLQRKIWPPRRQRAIMEHYAGRKFSPLRAYAVHFFPVAVFMGCAIVLANITGAGKQNEQTVRKVDPETTRRLLKQMESDTTYTHHPWYNGIGRKRP